MYLIIYIVIFFFFNDTATTEIYTLSLHDALPISLRGHAAVHLVRDSVENETTVGTLMAACDAVYHLASAVGVRSEEHTSELQSRQYLVCRLLLEKKNK